MSLRSWFEARPIHQKLVFSALAVTTAALLFALGGLLVVDSWRFRSSSGAETLSVARVMAENLSAAVQFRDLTAARETLETVRGQVQVRRACIYLPDGQIFAGMQREAAPPCPATMPASSDWYVVARAVPIVRNDQTWGTVYVEQDPTELVGRLGIAALICAILLVVAAALSVLLGHRLHRAISLPIAKLAGAARGLGTSQRFELEPIEAPPDEVGDLVGAFAAMVSRVREANQRLVESNEALQLEVNERQRMEAEREILLHRELQASRLKDEFLASVSHELRTPLNAIVGWTQVLALGEPSKPILERATASLLRNAQAQTRVIDDLIDISRIVTGKLQVTLDAVDLRSIVETATDVVRPIGTARRIQLTVAVPDSACLVQGDPGRLQQVLWNLLSNAMKFTTDGGSISVNLRASPDSYVVVVADTGIGITPEFLPHVFERFRQADGSMTRAYGGLGIGLAIVKELTELHGGTVAVSSAGTGLGASFTVTLPAARPAPVPAGPRPAVPPNLPSLRGVRILAVDDNEDALEVLSAVLSAAGADVRVASSAERAIDQWQQHASDVLLCDLAMPQMDGFQLLERIRSLDARSGTLTPAIAVTAYTSEESIARSARAGFQQHITKPHDPGTVVRAVASALNRV
jgi:signal transduction histidine kinase